MTAVHPRLVVRMPDAEFFGPSHPLAGIAAGLCAGRVRTSGLVGGVACGSCWETAIRADERVVVEFELEDAEPVPVDDVDEVAVRRAVAGQQVALTAAEQAAAVTVLAARSWDASEIAEHLGLDLGAVAASMPPAKGFAPVSAVLCPRPGCGEPVRLSARGGEQRLMCGACGGVFLSGDAQPVTAVAS